MKVNKRVERVIRVKLLALLFVTEAQYLGNERQWCESRVYYKMGDVCMHVPQLRSTALVQKDRASRARHV